jgi:hypothetical protein
VSSGPVEKRMDLLVDRWTVGRSPKIAFRRDEVGGVTNEKFYVRVARKIDSPQVAKLEVVSVPTYLPISET